MNPADFTIPDAQAQYEANYAAMDRRAEAAETNMLRWKEICEKSEGALCEARRNHEESNDAHGKDIVELTRQMNEARVAAELRHRMLRKMGYEGPPIMDKTQIPPDPEDQLRSCERENERFRRILDGIETLLSLAE